MAEIIKVDGLRKNYGDVVAVDGISFSVEENSLFAFLGPNGAGKSTVINIICTVLKPDSGSVSVNGNILGKDDTEIRKTLGIVFQTSILDPLLTVRENLRIRGALYGLKGEELEERIVWASDSAGTEEFLDRRYGKLSGGQKRRADIARALVSKPKILMLDEPTTGLDPQTRRKIWDTITDLKKEEGMTVFLTAHYMEEAEVADYVVIIDDGKIAAEGSPSYLKEEFTSDVLTLIPNDMDALISVLEADGTEFEKAGDRVKIKLKDTKSSIALLNRYKDLISSLEVRMGTMDDAFIEITGEAIR